MMTNSDMIIASIDDLPCVFGIALNSIIGRKILSGGNKKNDNIVDKTYLPNGLVQTTSNNTPQCSKLIVNSITLQSDDVVSDDLYDRLLELADIRKGESDEIEKSSVNKRSSKRSDIKPRLATTEKNKNKNNKNSKNFTRNNNNKK